MVTDVKKARLAVTMPRLSRYGGAESFAWRLSEALVARGHEVDFICARCETDPPDGVNPIVLGRFGVFRLVKILWFAFAADKACRQGNYDLVFGMGKTFNQDILRIGGGPITKFWDLSQHAWPEGFARSFKMFRRRMSPGNWAIHLIDRIRLKRTPRIVAVSHLVREWLVEAHPYLEKKAIDVIYNRPDLSKFTPISEQGRNRLQATCNVSEHEIVIGTAATNFALKGVRHLVAMLALLPDHYVLGVAGGRNPDKYLRQARELGVEKRIRFLGRVDNMVDFYRGVDIFILATFYDACSNAVLEAQACGCKVLSSSMNGSAHFLPDRWVFDDPSDVKNLARIVQEVAEEEKPPPFVWPDDVKSGIEPYVEMIEETLARK